MKLLRVKEAFLLSLPAVLLLGFGFTRPAKPTLKLKSVQIRPAINSLTGRTMKNSMDVEVLVSYQSSSWFSRFSEAPEVWFDAKYGLYVEDAHRTKYGSKLAPQDINVYRPFKSRFGPHGIGMAPLKNNPCGCSFRVPISQIPASGGQLRLKTRLESGTIDAPAVLPIEVVVRK